MKKQLEKDVFCETISQQSPHLYRLAMSYVRNEQDAMDIVQESVYKALKNRTEMKDTAYLGTWLYRVTVNTAIDFLRKRRKEEIGLPPMEEGREDDHGKLYVLDMLDRLDEKSKAIIILRFFEDQPLTQIAQILEENLSTVKTRLYKALRILRDSMKEEQYG